MSLTAIELKRILMRAPLVMLIAFIVPVFIISSLITGTTTAVKYTPTLQEARESERRLDALVEGIDNLSDINSYTQELTQAFFKFAGETDRDAGALGDFIHSTNPDPSFDFAITYEKFWLFYSLFEQGSAEIAGLYMKSTDYNTLVKGAAAFRNCFRADDEGQDPSIYTNYTAMRSVFISALSQYGDAMLRILKRTDSNIDTSKLEDIRIELLAVYDDEIYAKVEVAKTTAESGTETDIAKYADTCTIGYNYLRAHIRGESDQIKILGYVLDHDLNSWDYSTEFKFGKVIHKSSGTTPFDFIYNNLQLIAILLVLLGISYAVFSIFADIKNKTITPTLVSPHSRTRVITSKLTACALAALIIMLVFCGLYYAVAIILGCTTTPPAALVVVGGGVVKISPIIMLTLFSFFIYLEVLIFTAAAALLCVILSNLKIILAIMLLCIIDGVALHFLLSGISIVYLVPPMIVVWIALLALTVVFFNRKDF